MTAFTVLNIPHQSQYDTRAPDLTGANPPAGTGVSVIIPAYNYAKFLGNAVDSVLAQTFCNFELIVVDDGSTDDTRAVMERYTDGRVRYIYQANAGLSAARNTGIINARHLTVAFLDADDEWMPKMLQVAMRKFADLPLNFGLLAMASVHMDIDGNLRPCKTHAYFADRELTARDIVLKSRFMPSATLVRRNVFNECGTFDTTLRSSEDRDMWIRIMMRYRAYFLSEPLVRIRKHPQSMSTHADRMRENTFKTIKKARENRVVSRLNVPFWLRVFSIYYFETAWTYYDGKRRRNALGFIARSLLTWPGPLPAATLNEPPFFRSRALLHFLLRGKQVRLRPGRRPGSSVGSGMECHPAENGAPVKILHVVNLLEPGGMENGLVNVARNLDPARFKVYVACLERSGVFAERLPEPDNVRILGKKNGFSPLAVFRLAREISRIRPALIHTHNLGPLIYSSLATMGGITCPILHGEHSALTNEECSPRRLRQRRLLYHCCRSVHTVTHGLTRHLVELGFSPVKITTIVNGVDTDRFAVGNRSGARLKTGLPADAVVIGIVGRFGPFKRHAMLLEAFAGLGEEHPELHLLIVGSGGSEQETVREKARIHPYASRIHLTGFQDNPVPFYQSMDLLVIPSVNEGLSNALLEAMSCGVPVLANSACGNADVISSGEDGFVVDLETPEKLREQISKHLANVSLLPAVGSRARQKAASVFSIDRMVAGYVELYRKTGGKSPGGIQSDFVLK